MHHKSGMFSTSIYNTLPSPHIQCANVSCLPCPRHKGRRTSTTRTIPKSHRPQAMTCPMGSCRLRSRKLVRVISRAQGAQILGRPLIQIDATMTTYPRSFLLPLIFCLFFLRLRKLYVIPSPVLSAGINCRRLRVVDAHGTCPVRF